MENLYVLVLESTANEREKLCGIVKTLFPKLATSCCDAWADVELKLTTQPPDILILDLDNCPENIFVRLKQVNRNITELILISDRHDEELFKKIINLKVGFLHFSPSEEQVKKRLGAAIDVCMDRKYKISTIQELQKAHFFITNQNKGTCKFKLEKLVFIEQCSSKLIYHFTNGDEYEVSRKLDDCALEYAPYGFLKVQQSFIINMLHIERVKRNEKLIVPAFYPKKEIRCSRSADLWNTFYSLWTKML